MRSTSPTLNRVLPAMLAAVAVLAIAACSDSSSDAFAAQTTTPRDTTASAASAATTIAPTAPPSTTGPLGAPPSDNAGFRAQPTACGATPPPETNPQTFPAPEDLGLDPAVKLRATITTSCGEIVVELDPAQAPATVNSFVFLARQGYFNGTVSHRVYPGFVIQAGDPTGTGRGGPGYTIPDEPPPNGFEYSTGVLAMANAGPSTTGSQFFIMLGDSRLPPAYSVFGVVVGGGETLAKIQSVPLGTNSKGETSVPLETVYIESVVVEAASG